MRFINQKLLIVITLFLAVVIFSFTYFSIKESRSDSMQLLIMQGKAYIESLSSAAENAIVAEKFYDYLVHKRYNEITIELEQVPLESITDQLLTTFAFNHNLYGIYVFDIDSSIIGGVIVRGSQKQLPDYIEGEKDELIGHPDNNYLLLLDENEARDEVFHYYLKLSNKLDRVVLLIADALYYVQALEETQIGYLAQQMAQETGISYIIYQSTDGIFFSSRKTSQILAVESDDFLLEALDTDTVMHRQYEFEGEDVLEIVRPFASADFPNGLLRVGLSLNAYYSISRGYDIQMIIIASVLFLLLMLMIIYLNSRRKRQVITAQYQQIKTISDKIFDEMKPGVAAADDTGDILLANTAFEKIFQTKDLIGKKWDTVVENSLLSMNAISQSIDTVIEKEIKYTQLNGEVVSLLIAISKLDETDDPKNGVVAVVYDITNIKALEQKSSRKERLSEMGNLAAGVAHEIRNPLNTISIATQRLASEFHPSENKEEYLSFTRQIREETKRLNDIITRFLALARGEQQKNQTTDINGLIHQFVSFVQSEADKLQIAIEPPDKTETLINIDSDQMKQVLSNLFNNAKEALEGKPGNIRISVTKTANVVHIIFEDDGPGVPQEIISEIFTPYYTTKEAGTGLGLPTVHRIISDLGGEIKVEKSSLGGARFIISI